MKSIIKKIYDLIFYNPICKKPAGTLEDYLDIYNKIKVKKYTEITELENKLGFRIDEDFFNNLGLKTQISIKKSENNYQHGRLLYSLLSNYLQFKNDDFFTVVEIGTARGFSSICMSKALNDFNKKGNIITCDIISNQKKIFWNCILDCDYKKKNRVELLKEWKNLTNDIVFLEGDYQKLKKIKIKRVHFAFIDAQHEFENVKNEFEFISKFQLCGDILIFDDIQDKFIGVSLMVDQIEKSGSYSVERIFSTPDRGYAICKKN